MSRVMIHGLTIASTESFRRKIEIHLNDVDVLTSTDIEKTKDLVSDRAIHMLILETDQYTKKEINLVKDFRVWGLTFPILVVSNNVSPSTLEPLATSGRNDGRPHFVETGIEDKKLTGVIRKLLRTKQIPQQVHKRFHTNQMVTVEAMNEGATIDTSMYNLSKGGAYVEFDPEEVVRFGVGDLVRISVPLAEVDKSHALSGKVVWTTKHGRYSGRQGFGVKFISADEIYRSLLGKIA